MRIKHYQGYGIINAEKIKSKHINGRNYIDIKVWGNHEYGLDRSEYKDDVFGWLKGVIRNKHLTCALELDGHDRWSFLNNSKCEYETVYGNKDENGCDLDTGIYHLEFNDLPPELLKVKSKSKDDELVR